jgi:hypothetical protein
VQKSLTQTIENEFAVSMAGPVEACLPVLLLHHFMCMESSFKPQYFSCKTGQINKINNL